MFGSYCPVTVFSAHIDESQERRRGLFTASRYRSLANSFIVPIRPRQTLTYITNIFLLPENQPHFAKGTASFRSSPSQPGHWRGGGGGAKACVNLEMFLRDAWSFFGAELLETKVNSVLLIYFGECSPMALMSWQQNLWEKMGISWNYQRVDQFRHGVGECGNIRVAHLLTPLCRLPKRRPILLVFLTASSEYYASRESMRRVVSAVSVHLSLSLDPRTISLHAL